ncbi:MAG: dihydrolipoamide acetyltransferase family protein [Candidatus Dormibacteria bacterium]
MAITVTMPQLGESVTEGTIGSWLVQPGQQVEKFDSLVEVVTDKVTAEVPSPAAGTVVEILAPEGERLSVGQPICTLDSPDEVPATVTEDAGPIPEVSPSVPVVASEEKPLPGAPPQVAPAETRTPGESAPAPTGIGFISPAVRQLADEKGVDLAKVRGTGFEGRITKRDVLLYLEGTPASAAPAAPTAPTPSRAPSPAVAAPGERITLSPMRRSIAEHMVRSRHTSPHAWTMVEVDMSGVRRARDAQREQFRATTGVELSYLPFAMQATCLALRAVPTMNASFEEDAIVVHREVNLGLAVSVPDGLIVPVVKNADRYSIAGLARAASELIARARAGTARLEDVEGGTFTLNNAGALGTVLSQAIINQPQAGILVMDAVVPRPVVVGDAIAIRPMMNLTLSFDHRINDGSAAARLLGAVKSWLESVGPETPLY